jgi:hypothetical protein
MIHTRITELEQALTRTLAREHCDSEQGCSALANVLLAAMVQCRKDPQIAASVALQMHHLAALITRLAGDDPDTLDRTLDESRTH